MPKVQCAHCGAAFTPDACRTRYCDGTCYHAAQRARSAETLVARFWEKVDKSGSCWLWTGGTIRGYGQINLGRIDGKQRTVYAHRFAWTITNGAIADALKVCHTCDVPLCVNPSHMFLWTQANNLTDARQKGRLVDGAHLIRISDDAIAHIQQVYARGNGLALAKQFGISGSSVSRIARNLHRKPALRLEAARQPLRLSSQGDQPRQSVHAPYGDSAQQRRSSQLSLDGDR